MLKEWFRGSSATEEAPADAKGPRPRMVVDAEQPLDTPEARAQRRRENYEKKLSEYSQVKRAARSDMSYDVLFRRAQGIMLQGNSSEFQEGITLNISRNAQNTMMSSKWVLSNPKMSHWEVNLQMNGFTDLLAASWSTLNRSTLMYQRVSSSTGAVFVSQFMAQKQQGMTQGTLFALLMYPWWFGGCTQAQYVKDQTFSLSHMQRVIRGVHVGTNLQLDPTSHASHLSYALGLMTPKKDACFMGEITPTKGTWKVAATTTDWAQSMEAAIELEYAETRDGMASAINMGCKRHFVGGAQLHAALLDMSNVKVNLELPFGGNIPSMNQLRLGFSAVYDIHSGGLKQGITLTA